MLKVDNGNTRTTCEICQINIKDIRSTSLTSFWFFIVNCEQTSHVVLMFPLSTLMWQMPVGKKTQTKEKQGNSHIKNNSSKTADFLYHSFSYSERANDIHYSTNKMTKSTRRNMRWRHVFRTRPALLLKKGFHRGCFCFNLAKLFTVTIL